MYLMFWFWAEEGWEFGTCWPKRTGLGHGGIFGSSTSTGLEELTRSAQFDGEHLFVHVWEFVLYY